VYFAKTGRLMGGESGRPPLCFLDRKIENGFQTAIYLSHFP
jgi:hypothetical protein